MLSSEMGFITAIHEAGHAVARVLLIGRAGITEDGALRWIEMTEGIPHCSILSLPLNMPGVREAGERAGIKEGGPEPTPEQWRNVLFPAMRIDPDEWAAAELFGLIAGAVAQAKYSGGIFALAWGGAGCSDDRLKAYKVCRTVGLNEQQEHQLFREQAKAVHIAMERPEVWRAVVALATQLQKTGRMPGGEAVAIVRKALGDIARPTR